MFRIISLVFGFVYLVSKPILRFCVYLAFVSILDLNFLKINLSFLYKIEIHVLCVFNFVYNIVMNLK